MIHRVTCDPGLCYNTGDTKRKSLTFDLMSLHRLILIKRVIKGNETIYVAILMRDAGLLLHVLKALNNLNKERKPGLVFTRGS